MAGITARLMEWGTGVPTSGRLVVVLASAEHVEPALRIGPDVTVFAPGTDGPGVVGYGGVVGDPVCELSVGDDFYLQTQNYGVSAFLSVLGPTLVRVTDGADFAAYLADADQARETGLFPSFLVSPSVQLADVPALGGVSDGPVARLYVTADGAVSTSPCGAALGDVTDSLDALTEAWRERNAVSEQPCAVCLGGVLDERTRCEELTRRPWLPRYLDALAALRDLQARGVTEAQVSGFGASLTDVPVSDHGSRALLLWTDEHGYVHNPATQRTVRVNRAAAPLVDGFLALGSVDLAADWSADALGLRVDDARDSLTRLDAVLSAR